jgi:hypothetical protein
MAAAVLVATVVVTPASAAETPHWQLTLLPLPAGSPNAKGSLGGADGHGGSPVGQLPLSGGVAAHCLVDAQWVNQPAARA